MTALPVRIAHATDIHWSVSPPLRRLFNKRLLGSLNLWLRRGRQFDPAVQDALVEHIADLAPDAVLITGDLTMTALETEFERAREALLPLLERFPTLVIPGNHDVYTRGALRSRRMARFFGPWMGQDGDPTALARLDVGHVTVLGLDPNRPGLLSSGLLPALQLDRLAETLGTEEIVARNTLLALHYPVLDRHGAVYDGLEHGLRNARDLMAVLDAAPVPPIGIVHGHEHHGFTVDLHLSDETVPIFNPGSGGYAFQPERDRAACMNLYEIAPSGAIRVERYRYTSGGFQPEPGGPYATGR